MDITLINTMDLTRVSSTFPTSPENEILRENIVKHIVDSFTGNKKIIMIEDTQFVGKSVILSQFSRTFPDRCVSFFVGDDYWSSNLYRFLSELCEQMKHLTKGPIKKKISDYDFSMVSENELKNIFNSLYSVLVRQAKNGMGPYYFVIDGLDKIPEDSYDSLLKFIPKGASEGIFVLLSGRKGKNYNLSQHSMTIPRFSLPEAEKYLREYLSEEQIAKLFRKCDGLPGYLQEIRRQLINGRSSDELLENPPEEFVELLRREWINFDKNNDRNIKLLSTTLFSPTTFSLSGLSAAVNLDLNQHELEDLIKTIPFLDYNQVSDRIDILYAYKSFLSNKLEYIKNKTKQDLIQYFESHPSQENLYIYLPQLYKENGKFEALSQLINEESLLKMLGEHGQVSIVRKNLRLLAEMSYESKEWEKLAWATLTQSVFTQIISSPPAMEEEINALLVLEKYQDAISLAMRCMLPEDRLKLLSTVCNKMSEMGQDISDNLIKVLEDSVDLIDNSLELTEEIIDKLLDISAEIFPFHAKLALRLLKRIAEEKGDIQKNKLVDLLLMKLLVKIKPDPNTIDEIQRQFGFDSLTDFTKAASTAIASNSIDSILNQVREISDISAKLFLLQTWCNMNNEHPNCSEVIKFALDIMTESSTYTPTQTHMREFVQPLLFCNDIGIKKEMVGKFDVLKDSVLKNPIEEYARLELILAEIEKEWSEDDATKRLFTLIFYLDEIEELDTRCQLLIRILLSLKKIVPNDIKLKTELEVQFITEYELLLNSSADHYLISKRIIPSLTEYNSQLAENFINKINTSKRRDIAYSQFIRKYVSLEKDNVDFNYLINVLKKISFIHSRDWVFVQALKIISKNCNGIESHKKYILKDTVYSIQSYIGKSYALSYFLNLIGDSDTKLCSAIFENLKECLSRIDSLEQKIVTGYQASSIVGNYNKEWAESLFDYTTQFKTVIAFSDHRINELYLETCKTLISTIPEISKSQDCDEKIRNIGNFIEFVPSIYNKILLFNSLALKCHVSSVETLFRVYADKSILLLDNCTDSELYDKCINVLAPTLFLYERSILYDKLAHLPEVQKNNALYQVVKVLLSKRVPGENIDIKSIRTRIDFKEALQVCEVLEKMTEDATISVIISSLVDSLIEPAPGNNVRGRFQEKHLINIADRLNSICLEKLPDKNNIKHEGYLLIALGDIIKLKYVTPTYRAAGRWDSMAPDWEELRKRALLLPNNADRTFVLSCLASQAFSVDKNAALIIAHSAEKTLTSINNFVDRIERYQVVAEMLHEISNKDAAKYLLEKAMDFVKYCSYDERDQMMGRIIEVAHNVDPDLSTTLASKVDNPFELSQINDNIKALTLHTDPKKISNLSSNECRPVLGDVFGRLLKSLYSMKGRTQHQEVVGSYLLQSLGQDYETVNLGANWFIENMIHGSSSQSKSSGLDELFYGLSQLLNMIKKLGEFLQNNELGATSANDTIYKALAPNNTIMFGLNDEEKALSFIKYWLSENAFEYVKIYEPYFTDNYLFLLNSVSIDCRVQIMTSMKKSDIEAMDIKEVYRKSWSKYCDQSPPETHIFVLYSQNGKTPMHDRYIVTESAGLNLGTSLNGFGSRDTIIKILDYQEKLKIENELINHLMFMPPSSFEAQKLFLKTFTLD